MSWTTFLDQACPAEHAVQVYMDLDELAISVGRFLDAGFRAGSARHDAAEIVGVDLDRVAGLAAGVHRRLLRREDQREACRDRACL